MNAPTPEIRTSDAPPLLSKDAATHPQKTFWQKVDRIRKEYGYLLLAALIPAVIVYLLYLVRGVYPFGDSCVLVLDLNGQYISFYEALHDILRGDADLFYSFSRNLGGEFLGIYDYYVASPFALILGLFPERWMLEGLLVVFILKTAVCGLNMGIYLHKHAAGEPNRLVVLAFSMMYSLCSYCIVQQHNSMWIDAVLWLPLLALGIESLIRFGKFRLYVFSLAITIWSNFYIGYMVVIFTILYCFYDYFAHNRHNENNPLGEKNHFIKTLGRVLLWSVLAVGMGALVILSARYSLSFGKDDFSTANWTITQKFEIFEFLQKFLPASYDTVRPAGRPIVYCGILTVMLVPAYFMSKKFSVREKIASALLILVFVASFATSVLDLVWHGFQKPNWLNYRYSFMLCFFLIVLAYRAFDRIEFSSRKALLGSTAFIGLYVLLLPELADKFILKNGSENITTSEIRPFATVWLSLACLFVYFILIVLYGKLKKHARETITMVLVILVSIELFLSGVADMEELNTDVSYSKYSRYNNMIDTFRPISYLVNDYDEGFYRMEKTYERKTNDNFALQMNGVSLSTSTLNKETIAFLKGMGYHSSSHNSHYYYASDKYPTGTPVSDSLLGIKYLISDLDYTHYYGDPLFTPEDYDYDEDFKPLGQYDVYQNEYALSLIYGVADAWEDFDMDDHSSPFTRLNAMVTAMLGEDETVEIFKPAVQNGKPTLENATEKSIIRHNVSYTQYSKSEGTAKLTFQYTVPTDTQLYCYFPYPHDRLYNAKITTNGGSKTTTFTGYVTPIGSFDSEELKMTLELASSSLYIEKTADPSCIYYIDWTVFEDAMARLAETQVEIKEGYRDSHLFGSVTTAKAEQMMFTSIPYDEGWQIYVDGERVEIFKTADALISFTIEGAGEHEVELRYMPREISLGMAITIVFTAIFVILLILYPFAKRIPILKNVVAISGEPLPTLMTPERQAGIEPGDVGDTSLPPDPPTPTDPS